MAEWRDLLPRSFAPFFGRFHRLSAVQERGLPEIVAGRDVLLASPTASGKTETFAAPAAEVVLAQEAAHRGQLTALFVSPTRALANDLKRRLEAAYDDLGVGFGRYTGEHKERVDGALPEVCVTTPEALDSLLARRPTLLAAVRLLVLDEIHVLDGTPRGDQLRVLCWRLDRATEARARDDHYGHPHHHQHVQRVLASATVENPAGVAARYLRDPVIVAVPGTRKIRAKVFHGAAPAAVAQHLSTLVAQGFRKVLAFCNRRQDVETLAVRLQNRCVFGAAVFAHHGSLARRERERSERRFLEAPAAVLFTTTTLEMGIDIGSVDYVLLVGPPPDVASVLQRIGRGGRRGDDARAGCAVTSPGEAHRFDVLLRSAVRGDFLGSPYAVRPGVLVQQALALAGGRGHVDAESLRAAVPQVIWEEIAPFGAEEILTRMTECKLFEQPPRSGRHVLTEAQEHRWDRGVLHSNIDDGLTLELVDRLTGDVIGHLSPEEDNRQRKLSLAGGGRKVIQESEGRLLTDRTGPAEPARFKPRGKPFCSLAQGRAVVEALGPAPGEIRQIFRDGSAFLLHGLGTAGALWLSSLLEADRSKGFVESSSPYVLRLGAKIDALPQLDDTAAATFACEHEPKLAKLLGMGPFHRHLPRDLRVQTVRRAAGLDIIQEHLAAARLITDNAASATLVETAAKL